MAYLAIGGMLTELNYFVVIQFANMFMAFNKSLLHAEKKQVGVNKYGYGYISWTNSLKQL